MKKIKNTISRLIKDESGQGATEYILLLVVVVGLVVAFGPKIKGLVEGKLNEVSSLFGEVTGK